MFGDGNAFASANRCMATAPTLPSAETPVRTLAVSALVGGRPRSLSFQTIVIVGTANPQREAKNRAAANAESARLLVADRALRTNPLAQPKSKPFVPRNLPIVACSSMLVPARG